MPAPLRVVHKGDPKQDIYEDVGHLIEHFQPMGDQVLLIMYERGKQKDGEPVKTEGGIYLPHGTTGVLAEDKWQGKVGLVVAMGPIAFTEDEHHKWGHAVPKIGDWVMISIGDSYSFDLPGDRRARQVSDASVKVILQPEALQAVW